MKKQKLAREQWAGRIAVRQHVPRPKTKRRTANHAAQPKRIKTIAVTETPEEAQNIPVEAEAQLTPGSGQNAGRKGKTPWPVGKSDTPRQRPSHHRRWLIAAPVVFLLILLGVWTAGNLFGTRCQLGARTVASCSQTTAAHSLQTLATAYRLPVSYPSGQVKNFTLHEIGLSLDTAATAEAFHHQTRTAGHLLAWWRPVPVTLHFHTDQAALQRFISQNLDATVLPAKDAALTIVDGKAQVSSAVNGKRYGLPGAAVSVAAAAARLQTAPLRLTTLAVQPAVTQQALADSLSKVQKILSQHIVLAVGGQTVTPGPADIAGWLRLSPGKNTVNISVNGDAVQNYLDQMAANINHAPRSQVEDTNADGSVNVITPGANGVRVGDTSAAAASLTQKLLDGNGLQLNVPVTTTPFTTVSAPSSGKWIEVNTTTKRLYAYDGGGLVRTFLVSAGAAATPTVTGRFAIYAKYVSQDMAGENADGGNYFQPHVPWVNYFYRDYAIHGNYWRPASYFGNVNSSHGCVGLMVSDSAWVYAWAPIGTPVVVHR